MVAAIGLRDDYDAGALRAAAKHWSPPASIGYRPTNCLSSAVSRWCWSTPATPATRAGPQDRRQRRPMAEAAPGAGLPRASFRPKGELAALRAYLRQRERLLLDSASHIQHADAAAKPVGRLPRARH